MELLEIFREYGVEYRTKHRHVSAGWIGTDCPKCSPGWNKFRLGFEISSNRVTCWVCGLQDPVEALMGVCRIDKAEAISLWKGLPHTRKIITPAHTGTLREPDGLCDLMPAHEAYLKKRGFVPEEIIRLWGIRGIGMLGGKLKWRIYIPIHDRNGRQVSWTTRTIKPSEKQRYLSAAEDQEAVPHKTLLYGSHLTRQSVVCVEGPIDVWAIGPGGVATFGVNHSPQQVAEIAKYPMRVVCFDSSSDAQRRAGHLCEQLSILPGVTENVKLESGKDAAEADKSEIEELRATFLEN